MVHRGPLKINLRRRVGQSEPMASFRGWRKKGLRTVLGLGVVSFFTDISTEMVLSVLPYFIVEVLGGSRSVLGIIEGLAESTSYLFRTVSGVISDWIGRRKLLVIIGYSLSTLAKPLFATSRAWSDAMIVRITDRVGKGVRTAPRDALLSEAISEKDVGRFFGLHRSLDQLGAIVGPSLAFLLIPMLGIRGLFWFSFLPGIVGVAVLLAFVQESGPESKRESFLRNLRDVIDIRLGLLLLVVAIFSIGVFDASFVLLRSTDLGVTENQLPLIYALINVTHTLIAIPAGILSDKIGRERVLELGYLAFLSSCLMLISLSGSVWYAALIALTYGLFMGIGETMQRALVPSYCKSSLRGSAYGAYYLVVGISVLVSNSLVGMLWDRGGVTMAFTYSALTASSALIAAIFILNRRYNVKS